MDTDYEDNYWPEDAVFMERNSRDFVSRIDRINRNAEAISDILRASPIGRLDSSTESKRIANEEYSQRGVLS